MRVLVAEDSVELAEAISRGLRREGMAVDVALDGATALERASVNSYDVVLLDRDLPMMHGDAVCRQLVSSGCEARILMLTASGTVDDKVEGLELGADDYMAKPFAFSELVARLRALNRRQGRARPSVMRKGDLVVDPARRRAHRGDWEVPLTHKEFGVLEVLLAAEGAVVSAETLLEKVWDDGADPFTNTVRVTVMNLRRKLGDPPVIETVVGVGYRI